MASQDHGNDDLKSKGVQSGGVKKNRDIDTAYNLVIMVREISRLETKQSFKFQDAKNPDAKQYVHSLYVSIQTSSVSLKSK